MTAAPAPRTPLVVIGGFLGAGKTTLLNRWLADPGGRRLAVLVNDFGALNLDASLVAAQGADAVALSNGCVCCSLGDDLGAALAGVLARQPAPDAVVVEASGVGDPWRIAQFALVEPRLQLAAVLVLVDSAGLPALVADTRLQDSLATPLAHADLVLLNHADRATPAQQQASGRWVAAHAPGVAQLATVQAQLDLATLLDDAVPPHQARGGGLPGTAARSTSAVCTSGLPAVAASPRWKRPGPAHDQRFESLSVAPPDLAPAYERAALRQWVKALPPAVLRLKARLPLAGGGQVLLHWAGRHGSLQDAPPGPAAAPALVAIALRGDLPVHDLLAGLARCRAGAAPAGASTGPAAHPVASP